MSTKANIVIEQGTDWSVPINLTDQNGEGLIVTTFTVVASMRKYYNAANSISLNPTLANGSVTLSLSAVQSANIASGRYVYDVVLTNTSGNTVSRLVEGIVTVTPSVSHV